MAANPPSSRDLPAGATSRVAAVRHALLGTWPGCVLLVGAAIRLLAFGVRLALGSVPATIEAISVVGSLGVVAGGGYFLYQLALRARRTLLWRVRRKLILSYIFIGFVPALLIVAFFVVSGLLLFVNVGSYLVRSSLAGVDEEARFVAENLVREVERGPGLAGAAVQLAEEETELASRYPSATLALVPTAAEPCAGRAAAVRATAGAAAAVRPSGAKVPPREDLPAVVAPIAAGRWAHVDPPRLLPSWVKCSGFAGTIAVTTPQADGAGGGLQLAEGEKEILLVVRAITLPDVPSPRYAVIVDIPVNEELKARLREDTSIKLGQVSVALRAGEQPALPLRGRLAVAEEPLAASGRTEPPPEVSAKIRLPWVAFVEFTDWTTGWVGDASVSIEVSIADIYDRISAGQAGSRSNTGRTYLLILLLLGVLFLIIECAALVMGLLLAKSITGSVHQLFTGTERARAGDFGHRIAVVARDQLGELAESFNEMTGSIEDLMRQAEEKRRLEEELRIARSIQMSLLPQGQLSIPGLSVTALCVPAREVGGDYYDLLPLGDGRFGLLIADVSGKGTSAAFYMAELKGLMLSLCRIHRSPRELLVQANRIISDHLDSRSFITMIYAVIDTASRTMTYARAGHTPLILRSGNGDGRPAVQVLVPDGMVLGVRIDNGELFERLLEEQTLALGCGDLLLFFTDGVSDAMNLDSDSFGEARLARLVEEHGDLEPEELRERILREIQAFVGDAPQHDDMTMILLKVEEAGAGRERAMTGAGAA